MQLKIDPNLKEIWPKAALLVLTYQVTVKKSSSELLRYREEVLQKIMESYQMADIVTIPAVQATREAYKALGKSPSSYRNAAEAMIRRIVKGNGLYTINNVVEINNIISVSTGFSVGSYDLANLTGEIVWQKAAEAEKYQGIGKELLNVANLPTLYDDQGAFGNPTSDSQRGMIQAGERQVASVVYSFSGVSDLEKIAADYRVLLENYSDAENIQSEIIQ